MNTTEQAKKARNLMRTWAIGIVIAIAVLATFLWTARSDQEMSASEGNNPNTSLSK